MAFKLLTFNTFSFKIICNCWLQYLTATQPQRGYRTGLL